MHLHESILHFHEEPINLDPNARNIANIILANTHKPFSLLQAGLHNGETQSHCTRYTRGPTKFWLEIGRLYLFR
jgi:hypothetical protein